MNDPHDTLIDEEPIGTLDGVPEVERVIDEDSARMFTCRATVLTKAGFERFIKAMRGPDANAGVVFDAPVPVKGFDAGTKAKEGDGLVLDGIIGAAAPRWEAGNLVADVTIPYASEERLLIETTKVFAESTFIETKRGEGDVRLVDLWLTTRKPNDDGETPLVPIKF